MAAPMRVVTTSGQYKGYGYTIEQGIRQLFDYKGLVSEAVAFTRLYVEGYYIVPIKDIPGKEFTRLDQSEEAIKAYIDKVETEKLSQTTASGKRVITILGTTDPRTLRW